MALAMVAPTPNSTPLGGATTIGYKQSGGALWWTALPLPLVLHQPCAFLPPLVYLPSPPLTTPPSSGVRSPAVALSRLWPFPH